MGKEFKIRYDAEADILYVPSRKGSIARSVEVAPGITLEYGNGGEVVGLEILRASKLLSDQVVASLHAKQAGSR
ncbi:MAG: DUF2283 domain-containing protein [bacterium]